MKNFLRVGILGMLLAAQGLYAQEPAGEHGAESAAEQTESPLSTVFKWVNLLILLGGLGYLLKKPAMEFFDSRKADISTGLERAKKEQQESAARLTEIENRLAQLSSDIASLRVQAEQEAVTEKNRIISEAQREVDRVVEQSRQEIERIAHGIEREIKEKVADVVIDQASRKLQAKMTPDDQNKVVVRFIKNL